MAGGSFGGGTGVLGDPYLIEDAADLAAINNSLTSHYKLINDIDLNVSPYNTGTGWPTLGAFSGVLDGDGFKIFNLMISEIVKSYYIGLFQTTNTAAVIKNIKFTNANITITAARYDIGIVAGNHNGVIENVEVEQSKIIVDSAYGIGLIAGRNRGTIRNCYVDGAIEKKVGSTNTTLRSAYGLITGNHNGVIENCNTVGSITLDAYAQHLGGIIGALVNGTGIQLTNCHANVNLLGNANCGGVAGALVLGSTSQSAIVKNCSSSGRVESLSTGMAYTGGFVGNITTVYNSTTIDIENCFTTSSVYCKGTDIGGFSGYMKGSHIKNSYTTSYIESTATYPSKIGGFTHNYANVSGLNHSLTNCYAACTFSDSIINSATPAAVGAFIGNVYDAAYALPQGCYFDNSLGFPRAVGTESNSAGAGLAGQTTAELKIAVPDADTYVGWDAVTTDGTVDGTKVWLFFSGMYPILYYNTVKKFLIQDGADIKKWNGTSWNTIGTSPVTGAMFDASGMSEKVFKSLGVKGEFNSLVSNEIQVLCQSNVPLETAPILNITNLPEPHLILPLGDINLSGASNIDFFTLEASHTAGASLRVIASTDAGLTWKAWNGTGWALIDTTNLTDVKGNGMTKEIVNGLTSEWNVLRGESETIRFGYYMEISSLDDSVYTDTLSMQVDMTGEFRMAIPGTEYDYSYVSNDKLRIRFYKSGDYKVNYVD